ncbi:uncharacterized protein FPRO_11029 [Fusarium proliferatum ET1]|uniref:Uncharacterized protein n=1 Tax=Fusarium proliferatum (strain ET1) TaxID=1227346 RepID=A0A1L7VP53_FUSPR|nr:uncharacterized protein FPRO_11029 [Fusarium proliferatum ET1]CZR41440.1 uncharacterized protein FPRO_11029 [Fusarium proliferatum ET1]
MCHEIIASVSVICILQGAAPESFKTSKLKIFQPRTLPRATSGLPVWAKRLPVFDSVLSDRYGSLASAISTCCFVVAVPRGEYRKVESRKRANGRRRRVMTEIPKEKGRSPRLAPTPIPTLSLPIKATWSLRVKSATRLTALTFHSSLIMHHPRNDRQVRMITGFIDVIVSDSLAAYAETSIVCFRPQQGNNDPDAADWRFLNLMQPRRKQLLNNTVSHFTAKEPARRSMSPRYEVYVCHNVGAPPTPRLSATGYLFRPKPGQIPSGLPQDRDSKPASWEISRKRSI